MAQFILTNIFLISVGTVIYMMVRALPRIDGAETSERKPTLIERWVNSGIPEKLDAITSSYAGKLLRKLKVVVLRLDNYLTEKLKKANTNGTGAAQPGNPNIDFKEMSGEGNSNSTTGESAKK